ncbi:neuropeptide CCHamide-2 [Bombyx mandarina]|uniref:CCHamide n=2 Tax=Bombyx TaxID=7090 RepID=B3XYE5_BOMMO|nr:CCHamide precursor [Bombyx mori]XP_028026208.1 neuropeptide CCHamide-2 [Bombyx mandarina]BAG55002.1 CCHamide [Bombyx mori]
MAQICLAVSIAVLLMMSQGVSAKRGCSAFGHSCFGGHGKRSGEPAPMDMANQDMMVRHQLGQEETPPHPGYPHSSYNVLQPGDDIIPIRDGGVYDHDAAARDVMKYKLRNIFKHWMDNYRRSQNTNDEYFLETI